MNTLEIEFQKLMRERDFENAGRALRRWSVKSAIGPARSSFWRACLLYEQGQFPEAIAELSQTIADGHDHNRLCLARRARMFIDRDELQKALTDYQSLLSDHSARIVETYHASAAFRRAYILARLGDAGFEGAIESVASDYSEWVVDEIRTVSDLRAIHAKRRPSIWNGN